jgi:FkbM family methyltransferase
VGLLEGFTTYYNLFGVRGVLAASANRLTGHPREFTVRPTDRRYPVHLRLRTSDVSLFKDFRRGYDVHLPFPVRTVVDVGANIGMATLAFANKYPHATIVSVEPEPENYAMLVRNSAAYPNITPVHAALWNSDCGLHLGLTGLDSAEFDKWAFRVNNKGIPVRGITMQTLMRETGILSIDLLKMDIEGGEIEAFANCSEWMCGVQAVIIELHDHMRPGCKAVVDAACKGFAITTDGGETTYYVRPPSLPCTSFG